MTELIGVVQREKRIGPRTEPCGIPKCRLEGEEEVSPVRTTCRLSVRKDLNQDRAELEIPNQLSSLWKRLSWSTVSKAADRSSKRRALTRPWSIEVRRSFWTDKKAVSVE